MEFDDRKNSEEFKKDYLEIKYEDLVLNTEVTMRKILGFIDEEGIHLWLI